MHNEANPPTVSKEFTRVEFSLGDKLRKLRTQTYSSGEMLAQAIGVNKLTVNNYELDKVTTPRPAILLNWCVHTGGRPSEIMGAAYAHLDEPALEKIIQLRRRRVLEMMAIRETPRIDTELDQILAIEDDGEEGTGPDQTFAWMSDDRTDGWTAAS